MSDCIELEYKSIGTFEQTSTKIIVSDPCYAKSMASRSTMFSISSIVPNVLIGTWDVSSKFNSHRVHELMAVHGDYAETDITFKKFSGVGVDSGQVCICDYVFYKDDSVVGDRPVTDYGIEDPGDKWYNMCCHVTSNGDCVGTIPNGCNSSSGYGDGCYPVYVAENDQGQQIGIKVIFIGDD
jgi:hypothetical protein